MLSTAAFGSPSAKALARARADWADQLWSPPVVVQERAPEPEPVVVEPEPPPSEGEVRFAIAPEGATVAEYVGRAPVTVESVASGSAGSFYVVGDTRRIVRLDAEAWSEAHYDLGVDLSAERDDADGHGHTVAPNEQSEAVGSPGFHRTNRTVGQVGLEVPSHRLDARVPPIRVGL